MATTRNPKPSKGFTLGFKGLGFKVKGLNSQVQGLGLRVQGLEACKARLYLGSGFLDRAT